MNEDRVTFWGAETDAAEWPEDHQPCCLEPDELRTLIERRDYLVQRIKGKQVMGWETRYDEREHKALCWALARLTAGI